MKSSFSVLGSGSKSATNIMDWKPASIFIEDLELSKDHMNEAEEITLKDEKLLTIEKEMQVASFFSSSLLYNAHSTEKNLIKEADVNGGFQIWEPDKFTIETSSSIEEKSSGEKDSLLIGEIENKRMELQNLEAEIQAANIESEIIIQTARENAQRLLQETEEQITEIKEKAYQDGIQKAEKEAEEILKSATVYLDESRNWRKKIFQDAEGDVINMVQDIARKIFGEGFNLNAEQIEQVVIRAISEANRLGNLRVYMNPDDHDKLYTLWQDSELTVNGQKIQLVKSQNINPGGCFIEGEFGSVDSRIDVQLELIQSEISNALSTSQGELND